MARVAKYTATIVTNGSQAGSATVGPVSGHLVAVVYVKTDYANGVDLTVSAATGARNLLTVSAMNASATYYPLALAQGSADGANLTAIYTRIPLADETVTLTIAQGGPTKTGTFHVYVEGTP